MVAGQITDNDIETFNPQVVAISVRINPHYTSAVILWKVCESPLCIHNNSFGLRQGTKRVTFSDTNATTESTGTSSDSHIQRVWAYLTVKQLLEKEWVWSRPSFLFALVGWLAATHISIYNQLIAESIKCKEIFWKTHHNFLEPRVTSLNCLKQIMISDFTMTSIIYQIFPNLGRTHMQTVLSHLTVMSSVLFKTYDSHTQLMTQAAVIWSREGASEERGLGAVVEVQLRDSTHIHGGHQASGRGHGCAP